MLKHEDNPQAQPHTPPAAQVRVTPEELAAAITTLQIRKEGQPGTIAIGDAVEELGLDVTPEEVLAEMQARRQVPKPKKKRDYLALATGISAVGLAGLGMFVAWNHLTMPVTQHIRVDQASVTVKDASGRQAFLSEVKDGQVFQCRISNGGVVPTALSFLPGGTRPTWTLIKHNGKIYVRGWMPRVSNQVLQTEGALICVERDLQDPVAVTLPLEGFKAAPSTGGGDSVDEIWATDIHLDGHAYEKW